MLRDTIGTAHLLVFFSVTAALLWLAALAREKFPSGPLVYLRHGDTCSSESVWVCLSVCLCAKYLSQKVMNRFWWIFWIRGACTGTNRLDFGGEPMTLPQVCSQSYAVKFEIGANNSESTVWKLLNFSLLARYVPNVAKRSTWEQCIYWGPTDQRPTSHFGKFRTAISRQRVIRSTSCLVLW